MKKASLLLVLFFLSVFLTIFSVKVYCIQNAQNDLVSLGGIVSNVNPDLLRLSSQTNTGLYYRTHFTVAEKKVIKSTLLIIIVSFLLFLIGTNRWF